MAIDPPPCAWSFPPAEVADEQGVVAIGGDLEPGTLLAAYRQALFPMPLHRHGPLAWWSPNPRAIIPLERLRMTRSLRRSCRRFEIRIDTAFEAVIDACADPWRPHGWITTEVRDAYVRLHELGWAHSVEAWTPDGRLAGGLYGMAIGGLFAGESMFYRVTDASKAALVGLVERLRAADTNSNAYRDSDGDGGARLLDVQWATPHLHSLGAIEVPVTRYLALLEHALRLPLPPSFR